MVYFKKIRKTRHYVESHENAVPWFTVVEVIFKASKKMRRKGNRIEIEDDNYYVLCKIEKGILFVINAKIKR